jgi:hypothetical protein
MTSTDPITSADLARISFAYIDCDVPIGQSLTEWSRERAAVARAERRARRWFRRKFALSF